MNAKSNSVMPLRTIKERFADKEGPSERLSCGHVVPGGSRKAQSRRCPKCPTREGPEITPSGPVALRKWFAEYYGWPDRKVKDISKLHRWFIDELDAEKRHIYETDCRLLVIVVDDRAFELQLMNTELAAAVRPDLAGLDSPIGNGAMLSVSRLKELGVLADAIDQVVRRSYCVPSFKYVCPRTATRLRDFARELSSYVPP